MAGSAFADLIRSEEKWVIWDFDEVIYTAGDGKGTTLLAYGIDKLHGRRNSEDYMLRFGIEADLAREQEDTKHPLYPVTAFELKYAWSEWSRRENNGKPITTFGELATCLTALRHKIPTNRGDKTGNVFPSSDQTVYTKNSLLVGLSMAEVQKIIEGAQLAEGFAETVEGFRQDGWSQAIFSETNKPIIDSIVRKHRMDYGGAVKPVVEVVGEGEVLYDDRKHFGRPDVALTGRMGEYDKREGVINFMAGAGVDLRNVIAVDNSKSNIQLLGSIKNQGGRAYGFNTGKDTEAYRSAGIAVVKGLDIRNFLEVIRNPQREMELCD